VPENPETVSVKPVQTIYGSEPQKTIPILEAAGDTVVGQTVFYKIVFEIIGLGSQRRTQITQTKQQYGNFLSHEKHSLIITN